MSVPVAREDADSWKGISFLLATSSTNFLNLLCTAGELESIRRTGRLKDYDIKISESLDIDNTIDTHEEAGIEYGRSGIEYGRSFVFVTMTRKKFSELPTHV